MWKKIGVIALAILLVVVFAACAEDSGLYVKPSPTAEPEAQIPNPVTECESSADFLPLDLYIDAPEGAESVRYSTISDTIAQVNFTLDNRAYTYRAAHTNEDISGLYVTFDEAEQGLEADGTNWYASIRTRTIGGGAEGALSTFAYGGVSFTLYTGDAVTADTIGALALKLAEAACPHHVS